MILGNNVFAHVPDINDFVREAKNLLKDNGTATFEFPHILNLINESQFDIIYHEHFSYFLMIVQKIFDVFYLKIYDVVESKTYGGSLRIFVSHKSSNVEIFDNVEYVINKEKEFNLDNIKGYSNFEKKLNK